MRRPRTWIVVLAIVVVAVAALAGLRAAQVSGRWRSSVTQYSTAEVTRGSLEVAVSGTGTLAARARQDAVGTTTATVDEVLVQPGDTVAVDEPLLRLSSRSLEDQVLAARLDLRLAEIDLETLTGPEQSLATEADIALARASLESADLAARTARENAEDLTLEAPFAGQVAGLAVTPGAVVAPGTVLFTVLTPECFQAHLAVPENEVEHLAVGDELTITVTPISRDLSGRVAAIDSSGTVDQRGAVSYRVTVDLDDYDPAARGGMTVSATIDRGGWFSSAVTVRGTLAYDQEHVAVTPTGGEVVAVAVAEGSAVSAGQLVVTLDNDSVGAALAKAEADLLRAEESLRRLTDPGPPPTSDAQVEKARVRRDQAALKLSSLERQLADLTVRAEIAGTVTDVFVHTGDRVALGQRLVAVADLTEVRAVITVDELEVAGLVPGAPATVRIDAFPGETFSGTLDSVSLEGVPRDGVTSYEARISLPGSPGLRAGMSLSASITVARRENVLIVPVEAVYGAGREAMVQVLVRGQPVARQVVAGVSNDTFTEILEGLSEGETIITGSLVVEGGLFGGRPDHSGDAPGSSSGGDD